MLKKIKKIGGFITLFLLATYNKCFADVVMTEEDIKNHGRRPMATRSKPINYILIGILVLVIIICAVIIIRRIIKKKKDNSNNYK